MPQYRHITLGVPTSTKTDTRQDSGCQAVNPNLFCANYELKRCQDQYLAKCGKRLAKGWRA